MRGCVRARAGAVLTAAVVMTGCTGTGQDTTTPRAPAQTAAPTAPSPSTVASVAPSPMPPPTPTARLLDVVFAGGEVSGIDPRVPVKLGEKLLIRVTSDVADEVHVHGYDLYGEVAAGGTVEIPMTASIPGGFEVELEKLGKTLFQLRVS